MTWARLRRRNGLNGGYVRVSTSTEVEKVKGMIAGDMNRIEEDMRDAHYIPLFAAYANITEREAEKVLIAFFNADKLTHDEDGKVILYE